VATAALLGAFSAGALALVLHDHVVACHAELSTVWEPSGWRSWPLEMGLGTYTVEGEPLMVKYQLGLIETDLRDPGLCPRGGVSLDGWFVHGPQPSMYRSRSELRLRRGDGVWVVSGLDPTPPQKEVFIVAFRRDFGRRLAFTSGRAAALSLALASVLALTAAGLAFARRVQREARRYADASIYKPGRRNTAGAITFDDGSAPIAPERSPEARPAGPVLVRVAATRAGTYREAPSTRAMAVVTGDAETLASAAVARATSSLGAAATTSIVILAAALLIGSCMAVGDVMRSIY
jgi:hypothetical protein